MNAEIAGRIGTDRKPRERKTLAQQMDDLSKAIAKCEKAAKRANEKLGKLMSRRADLLAEAKAVAELSR